MTLIPILILVRILFARTLARPCMQPVCKSSSNESTRPNAPRTHFPSKCPTNGCPEHAQNAEERIRPPLKQPRRFYQVYQCNARCADAGSSRRGNTVLPSHFKSPYNGPWTRLLGFNMRVIKDLFCYGFELSQQRSPTPPPTSAHLHIGTSAHRHIGTPTPAGK